MNNKIINEIQEIKYLFDYKRGTVISEQKIQANIDGLKKVQETLKALGYTEVGTSDGQIGPKTLAGISRALGDLKTYQDKAKAAEAAANQTNKAAATTQAPAAETTQAPAATTNQANQIPSTEPAPATTQGAQISPTEPAPATTQGAQISPTEPAPATRKEFRQQRQDLRQAYRQQKNQ